MGNSKETILLEMEAVISSLRQQLDGLEAKINLLKNEFPENQEDEAVENDDEIVDFTTPVNENPDNYDVVGNEIHAAAGNDDVAEIENQDVQKNDGAAAENAGGNVSGHDASGYDGAEETVNETVARENVGGDADENAGVNAGGNAGVSAGEVGTVGSNAGDILFGKDQMTVGEKPLVKKAVIDVMSEKQAWRKDRPGSEVRDIRSAISLNDRVLFINSLFSEDPVLFQDTLTRLNGMDTLDEAFGYLSTVFLTWDFESDVVYRFMMAVRRKIR